MRERHFPTLPREPVEPTEWDVLETKKNTLEEKKEHPKGVPRLAFLGSQNG